MSAEAALLPCPICSHAVFDSAEVLRERLINVSTNKILCPVCQEEVVGLDKLTIHLFSHINIPSNKVNTTNAINREGKCKTKADNSNATLTQTKKCRPIIAKNKTMNVAAANAPVKFVKIYPKLPVLSLNTLPVIEISRASPASAESQIVAINNACNVCGLQFLDANILRMHKWLIHNIDVNSNVSINRYPCHMCSKSFKMKGSLMVHLRVAHYGFSSNTGSTTVNESQVDVDAGQSQVNSDHHSCDKNDNKQWQCDVCKKCFTTKYFLKKHKRLHTGETPYACTQCNKTFTFQQSYHKHLLYHNDEKPHICTYCGRAFKELSTLHNHQRIHTGEKPFSCETCGKCFRQRVSYLVHKRIHTGVMPYKCTACDKSFRYKVSQRTHKCQAQPPGTVVRQSGDLIEKLLKKHEVSEVQESTQTEKNFQDITEAHAELVRTGAKLSLEDTEAESFNLIADAFEQNRDSEQPINETSHTEKINELVEPSISDLIDFDVNERNLPSPSEILKNLCLSKEDDYTMKSNIETNLFNVFL